MAEFVKLGSVKDIPSGKFKGYSVGNAKVLVANVSGKFLAVNDVCTHFQCIISQDGELNDDVIHCMCHGSRFKMKDGSVVNGPATKPLDRFDVKVVGNDILVKV